MLFQNWENHGQLFFYISKVLNLITLGITLSQLIVPIAHVPRLPCCLSKIPWRLIPPSWMCMCALWKVMIQCVCEIWHFQFCCCWKTFIVSTPNQKSISLLPLKTRQRGHWPELALISFRTSALTQGNHAWSWQSFPLHLICTLWVHYRSPTWHFSEYKCTCWDVERPRSGWVLNGGVYFHSHFRFLTWEFYSKAEHAMFGYHQS